MPKKLESWFQKMQHPGLPICLNNLKRMKHLLDNNTSIIKRVTLVLSKFRRSIYFILFGIFSCLGLFSFLLKSELFIINSVNCKTQFGPCSTNEETILSELKGKNFFTFQSNAVNERLYQDSTNRDVFIERVFPKSITVVIVKRKPVIVMRLDVSPGGVFL